MADAVERPVTVELGTWFTRHKGRQSLLSKFKVTMMPAVPIVQPGVEGVDPRVEPPFGEAPELKVCSAHETYTLQRCLGAGSFGRVFMCWAETARCQVAIKMIPGHSQYNRVASNEIRILSHISKNVELAAKAHLPSLREAFRTPCNSCFVFDLLGKNLHEVHRENNFRPFALRHVRVIAQQLLLALSQLKEWGIIHADLKPENILLANDSTKNFHVQLIDFGSSSFSAEVKFVRDPYIQSRYYRAPEILLGAPFSEKVDMWSLGCVLAELLLCWPLYPGSNEYDQVPIQGWRLKSCADYQAETGIRPQERRRRVLNSLKSLQKNERFYSGRSAIPATNLLIKSNPTAGGRPQTQLGTRSGWPLAHKELLRPLTGFVFNPAGCPYPNTLLTRNPGGGDGLVANNPTIEQVVWNTKYNLDRRGKNKISEDECDDEGYSQDEQEAAEGDQQDFITFLQRLLTLDPIERIAPSPALYHPFISLASLRTHHANTHYHARAEDAMEEVCPGTGAELVQRKVEASVSQAHRDRTRGNIKKPQASDQPSQYECHQMTQYNANVVDRSNCEFTGVSGQRSQSCTRGNHTLQTHSYMMAEVRSAPWDKTQRHCKLPPKHHHDSKSS